MLDAAWIIPLVIGLILLFILFYYLLCCNHKEVEEEQYVIPYEIDPYTHAVQYDAIYNNSIYNTGIPVNKVISCDKVYNIIHPEHCVNGDINEPIWKLSCGLLLCDFCMREMINSPAYTMGQLLCPVCFCKVDGFSFYNRNTINGTSLFVNNDVSAVVNNQCKVCFTNHETRLINCQSMVSHKLCETCYIDLMLVQRVSFCPFCRTIIKER
jgi:hypothetical protein